ncbi:MAG: hypothetical protein NTW16_02490 [Bacteroidetes bacterium]|nr:hypothetical protein [Bacteroidota bacterium]
MKTNKYFIPALGFFAGLALGTTIIGLFAFTNGPGTAAPGAGTTLISSAEANGFIKKYLSGTVPMNQVIKGFTVDKSQLDAMNTIAKSNPDLASFRIYLGKDNNAKNIGIVVGVDNAGQDAVRSGIYSTEGPRVSPCPPICDATSPITLDK